VVVVVVLIVLPVLSRRCDDTLDVLLLEPAGHQLLPPGPHLHTHTQGRHSGSGEENRCDPDERENTVADHRLFLNTYKV